MSSLSATIAQATLDTSPITIFDRAVAGRAWGVTFFKNLSSSGGDVYLTLTGSPDPLPKVLNPGDVIAFRLAGNITKVTAIAASTATLNYGPQTDGGNLQVFNNFTPNG